MTPTPEVFVTNLNPRFTGVSATAAAVLAEQARDMALFRASGVSEAFIERVTATPASDMWYPDRAVLVASGVVAGVP